MYDKHPIRLSILHMVPAMAERYGLPFAPLYSGAGIDPADVLCDDRIVVRAQIMTILQHMAQRTGEPTIGLDLAGAAMPQRLGLSGEALFSGRTLRECFQNHARHMPSLQGGVSLGLVESGGLAHWHHRLADGDAEQAKVLNEGIAGFVVAALRAICGNADTPVHVQMPHRAHAPARVYEDKLRADVSFRPGSETVMTFDADLLDRPNVLMPLPVIGCVANIALDEKPVLDDAMLLASLHLIFETAAIAGTLSLLDAAKTLGIAPRSLQRRLAGLDTSFEVLVDEWRASRAVALLAEGAAIQSIAHRLGYSHAAHFTRAFRRWQGVAPTGFRARWLDS